MLSAISALAPSSAATATGSALVGGVSPKPMAPAAAETGAAAGPDFGTVFNDVAQRFLDTMKEGEAAAIAGVQGKAAVQDVVQAVMSAEQSLHLAMAMRDKVVAAYQEFSHMAI